MISVDVKRGSLTEGKELVLVNASNTNALLGSGVSAAIRAACGPGYQERICAALERRFGGPMEPGAVLITDAGAHPSARYVAHVAVMDYRDLGGSPHPTVDLIRRACATLWRELEALCNTPPLSVAMVALGAGTGGLDVRASIGAACETLAEHLQLYPKTILDRVVFYGYALNEYQVIREVVGAHFPLDEAAR